MKKEEAITELTNLLSNATTTYSVEVWRSTSEALLLIHVHVIDIIRGCQ
jgi:hypothetical protein